MTFVSSGNAADRGDFSSQDCKSLLAVLGGTMLHLIVGVKIMWGCITPYVTSYLHQFDSNINYNSTLHVYTAVIFGQTISMYFGGLIETAIGPKLTALIGTVLISGGTFFSSYCIHLRQLLACQAIVGIGIGIAYSAPITCGFKHFPTSKGIVAGIITTGTGIGPFVFNFFAADFVNPSNAFPMDVSSGLYRHDSPVVQRVPGMFRLLGILFAIVGITGSLLLGNPKSDKENELIDSSYLLYADEPDCCVKNGSETTRLLMNEGKNNVSYSHESEPAEPVSRVVPLYSDLLKLDVLKAIPDNKTSRSVVRSKQNCCLTQSHEVGTKSMIRDPLCWLVIACKLCTCTIGMYVVATYKSFGRTAIPSDHYLTFAGNIAILCSALCRSLWGLVADKIGTFRTVELMAYTNPILLLLYTITDNNRIAFCALLCSLLIAWGSTYALFPSIVAMLFGEENMGQNYGFIFFAYGIASTALIDSCGHTNLSFRTLNLLFVVMGIIGAALSTLLRRATQPIKDEKFMKHHRATSSFGSSI